MWRFWRHRPPDLRHLNLGEAGEVWVAYLYARQGYKILERNFTIYGPRKMGEIDLICKKGKLLVIVEVKTRRDERFMSAVEAVNARKQSYLLRMAKLFLQQNPRYENFAVQIDVATVLLDPFDNSVKSVKLLENVIEDSD